MKPSKFVPHSLVIQKLLKSQNYFYHGIFWLLLSLFFLFEISFNSLILFNLLLRSFDRDSIWLCEIVFLIISTTNAIYYFWDASRRNGTDFQHIKHYLQQYFIVSKSPPNLDTSLSGNVSYPSEGYSDLISVFDFLANFFYTHAATSKHGSSFNSSFDRSWASARSNGLDLSYSPSGARRDESLDSIEQFSSQIGYRNSPRNKSTSSIHTKEQLDSILHSSVEPKIERSFLSRTPSDMDMHNYEVGTIESPFLKRDTSLLEELKTFSSNRSPSSRLYENGGELQQSEGLFPRRRRGSSTRRSLCEASEFRSISPLFDDRSLNIPRNEPESIFDEHENQMVRAFKKCYLDVAHLPKYELKLRVWLCNTVLRPLVEKIGQLNTHFVRSSPPIQLKLGETSLENIHTLLSSKIELCSTALPLVLPYLRIHTNQTYLVQRIRELAADITLKEFNWNSGGKELIRDSANGMLRVVPWHESLPTDAELIWNLFCVYMDSMLSPTPFIVNNAKKPFTNVYFHKKSGRFNAIQCGSNSFFIVQVSERPPLFEFATNGGLVTNSVSKEGSNLFQTMLLFIAHCKEMNKSRIDHLNLTETGLNLIEVIS